RRFRAGVYTRPTYGYPGYRTGTGISHIIAFPGTMWIIQWERLKSMFISQRFLSFILPPAVLMFVLFAGLTPLSAAMGRALPKAGVLAFSTPADPRTEWHIILLDVRTRIAHTIGRYGWRIALPLEWSPDGSRLAFATVNTPSDIFIHDIY